MKKNKAAIVLLLLATALTVRAQKPPAVVSGLKEVSLISFQKLAINTGMDVILVQDTGLKKAIIEGYEASVAGITLFIARGTLTVSGKKDSYKGKVKLTIPVNKLSMLEINADTDVSSLNALSASRLTVYVNGDCKVNLKSTGKIFVTGNGGHEVRYVKNVQKGMTEKFH